MTRMLTMLGAVAFVLPIIAVAPVFAADDVQDALLPKRGQIIALDQ